MIGQDGQGQIQENSSEVFKLLFYFLFIFLFWMALNSGLIPILKAFQDYVYANFRLPGLSLFLTAALLVSLIFLWGSRLPARPPSDGSALMSVIYTFRSWFQTRWLTQKILTTIAALCAVGLILLYLLPGPCQKSLIGFQVTSGSQPTTLPSESQYPIQPGDPLIVKAFDLNTNLELAPDWTCRWSYAGDGFVIETVGCSLQVKSGPDNRYDLVSLDASHETCRQRQLPVLFLQPEP